MKAASLTLCVWALSAAATAATDPDTGLVVAPGLDVVKANCTVCHSARLISQSRADRQGWLSMIQWMQKTQNLWPLGPNEPIILDYLATNYAPEATGRRANLPQELMPPAVPYASTDHQQ